MICNMNSLVVSSLSVSLGKKNKRQEVLHSLNFSIPLNQITVIMGESGSGKTTLLRAIAGLTPYSGDIIFDDINLNNIKTKDRNFSYVNQNIALYPHLTLFQNIAFPLKGQFIKGDEIRKRVIEGATKLGIQDCLNARPNQVSLGQCQKAAVAKSLIKKSELYLFDEPFANVDEAGRFVILNEFKRALKEEGASVIYVTHSFKEAMFLGDFFVLIKEGNITSTFSKQEFIDYATKVGINE